MGLIKAALGAAGGVMADQWKEYFYCDALEDDVLVMKGQKRTSKRSSNRSGSENIITGRLRHRGGGRTVYDYRGEWKGQGGLRGAGRVHV